MSKFKELLDIAASREPEPETPSPERLASIQTPATQSKKLGRPKGKRSNPDYEQVTAYIRSQTYRDVKIALLQRGGDREFSELVEELLTDWLNG